MDTFFHRLPEFVAHHWLLVTAFVLVLVAVVIEERRNAFLSGGIKPKEAVNLLNHQNASILDLRSSTHFEAGHVLKAKSIPFEALEAKLDSLKKLQNRPIIVVCDTGRNGLRAAAFLKSKQFKNVHILAGGMDAWEKEELPVVRGKE
ncbi:MAG TPA: rhodanese-like domain-containing protein [Coxiellaceae bacterium]|nr:rhodanese-like domain-containing protein [Coxiellaceae bacterium]